MISFKKKDLSRLHNIGDLLCTPDNYFDIRAHGDITIVGGGVWNIEKLSREASANKTVIWAAGRSIRYPKQSNKFIISNFRLAGFRDILDLEDKSTFLPCVSCLHDLLMKEPNGNKTLVFTNANEQVSSKVEQSNDRITITNACTTEQFLDAWSQCDKVITNSYHGIYWSLLSNREVSPYGYSSKFVNVTALFDIEFPSENLYKVSERFKLPNLINKKQLFISAKDNRINQFRDLNLEFAENCKNVGVICKRK